MAKGHNQVPLRPGGPLRLTQAGATPVLTEHSLWAK